MALRDTMRESVTPYLRPGEAVQTVVGAQTASQYLIFFGLLPFYLMNRCRMLAVTPQRILVLDTGRFSWKKARGVVTELPRPTRLGPGSGVWHVIPVGHEKLRVHRRFFKDLQTADSMLDRPETAPSTRLLGTPLGAHLNRSQRISADPKRLNRAGFGSADLIPVGCQPEGWFGVPGRCRTWGRARLRQGGGGGHERSLVPERALSDFGLVPHLATFEPAQSNPRRPKLSSEAVTFVWPDLSELGTGQKCFAHGADLKTTWFKKVEMLGDLTKGREISVHASGKIPIPVTSTEDCFGCIGFKGRGTYAWHESMTLSAS